MQHRIVTHIDLDGELRKRWPRLGFALSVGTSGYVHADYFLIVGRMDHRRVQGVERAEAWEELAALYEWRFEQRAGELANDPALRYLVATWTDSMCYSLRRSAAFARGEDPGPVIPQPERIPQVYAELRERLDREYGSDRRRAECNGRVVELAG
jgi:hypothetical protein